jgi:hypothetical protein
MIVALTGVFVHGDARVTFVKRSARVAAGSECKTPIRNGILASE